MSRRVIVVALCSACWASAGALTPEASRLTEKYLDLLKANPDQKTAFERLCTIHIQAGESARLAEIARSLAGDQPVLAARLLRAAGDANGANALLAPLAKIGNREAAMTLADSLEESGAFAAAAAIIEGVPSPDSVLLIRLGALESRAGRRDRAEAAWARAVELAPSDMPLRRQLAKACIASGNLEGALRHLRAAAGASAPANRLEILGEMADELDTAGRWTEALAVREEMLALLGPGHWNLEATQRQVLETASRAGELDALATRWTDAVSKHPQDAGLVRRMAALAAFREDVPALRRWINQSLTIEPGDARLLRQLGAVELREGALDKAAAAYDRALVIEPDDADTLFARAEIDSLLGDGAAASHRVLAWLALRKDDDGANERARDFFRRFHLVRALEDQLIRDVRARPDREASTAALAQYYLDEHRFDEAAQALNAFPSKDPAVALRFADLLHSAGLNEPAAKWARFAADRDPASAGAASLLVDILMDQGLKAEAITVLERMPLESNEDLDHRLFLLVSASDGPPSPEITAMIRILSTRAEGGVNAAASLRLARWLSWSGDEEAAVVALRTALIANLTSAPLRIALADALLIAGRTEEAAAELNHLRELHPDQADEADRKLGRLEIQRGRGNAAVEIFSRLAAKDPGNWHAISDLALAQQAAGNWFEAFDTWVKAYPAAPSDSRRAIKSAALAAANRVGLKAPRVEFLESAAAVARTSAERAELEAEATAFARSEQLPSKIPVPEAPRPAASAAVTPTEDDVEAAAKRGDFAEAARLAHRRTVAEDPPRWETAAREADYLVKAGEREAARKIWNYLTVRFARTPEALLAAAEFYDKSNDPGDALRCLRSASNLTAPAPAHLLRLARDAEARGDVEQAIRDCELLLRTTTPGAPDVWPLPEPDVLSEAAQRGEREPDWPRTDEAKPADARLSAISMLGRIRPIASAGWLTRFSAPHEKFWALWSAGLKAEALDHLAKRLELRDRDAETASAFCALALDAGLASSVVEWAGVGPATGVPRWQAAVAGATRLLTGGWRPDESLLEPFFFRAPAAVRWQLADALAARGRLRIACALGESVPVSLPAEATCAAWVQIARWRVSLRDPAGAAAALDQALGAASARGPFGDVRNAALRTRWLLTAPERRSALAVAERSRHDAPAATLALVAELEGDSERAARELTAIAPADRDAVAAGGAMLEAWGFPRLARDFYRRELERDNALSILDEGPDRKLVEGLLVSNLLRHGPARSIPYIAREWSARWNDQELPIQAVRRLSDCGERDRALALASVLLRESPTTEMAGVNLLGFLGDPNLIAESLGFVERLRFSNTSFGRSLARTAALRLETSVLSESDPEMALAVLSGIDEPGASATMIVLERVKLLRLLGRNREALAEIERAAAQPGSSPQLALPRAELLASLGRDEEAIALLFRAARDSACPDRLAAVRLLGEWLGDDPERARQVRELSADLVPGFAEPRTRGEAEWIRLLEALDTGTPNDDERFAGGRIFLLSHDGLPGALRDAELARLTAIAARRPSLRPALYTLRKSLAARAGAIAALVTALTGEWGRGEYLAGEILIQLFIEQRRIADLDNMLGQFLVARYFRENAWAALAQSLLAHNLPTQAERVLRAFSRMSDGSAATDLALAEALWRQNRHSEAALIEKPLIQLSAIDGSLPIDLARHALNTDRPETAAVHLAGVRRAAGIWTQVAAAELKRGNPAAAQSALAAASSDDPSAIPAQLVVDVQEAAGRLPTIDPASNDFRLPRGPHREWQSRVIQRLIAKGRTDRVFEWFETDPGLLEGGRLFSSLCDIEGKDRERAARIWRNAAERTKFAVTRAAAAAFQAREAGRLVEAGQSPTPAWELANQWDPSSFPIAKAYCEALLRDGGSRGTARKVLERLLSGYAEPAVRRAARQMLRQIGG